MRYSLLACSVLLLLACGGPGDEDAGPRDAANVVIGPDGEEGVCCPVDDAPSCDCTELGGWARSFDQCQFMNICDAEDFSGSTDAYGCPILVPGPGNSCLRLDGGPGDAGPGCTLLTLGDGHRPADVILMVDTSASMSEEIASLEASLDPHLMSPLDAAGVAAQLIMIAEHGAGTYDVCVPSPISGTTDCAGPPVEVPGRFRHYDTRVLSNDAVCVALDTFAGAAAGGRADTQGEHPNGWSAYLREDALKVFVVLSDDNMRCGWSGPGSITPTCTGSTDCFDDAEDSSTSSSSSQAAAAAVAASDQIFMLSADQFGSPADYRYVFHTIGGLEARADGMPHPPTDPFVTNRCSSAVSLSAGYQWLSMGTSGQRFPSCDHPAYDVAFDAIAASTAEQTLDPCRAALPDGVDGTADLEVDLTITAGASPVLLSRVNAADQCAGDDEFYVTDDATVALCPLTCERVTDESSLGARRCG